MCGIVGYITNKPSKNNLEISIEALKRLEYRGYDSAGTAFWDDVTKTIVVKKSVGKISELERKLYNLNYETANPVIMHTRWATHGEVTETNAHPHTDCTGNVWIVHNGIIENYKQLKKELELEGHKFSSQTDTEVIAHLIERYFTGNLEEALRQALSKVKGTYGLVAISRDDPYKIVAARLSSPLLIGVGKDEFIVASDPTAVISHTRKIIQLDDREIAIIPIRNGTFTIIKEKQPETLDVDIFAPSKGPYPHFMLKEIMEQPETIDSTLKGRLILEEGTARLGGLESIEKKLRQIDSIYIVACGTSRHAGLIGEYAIEEYAGIRTKTEVASEFRYRKSAIDKNTALIAISQSGETADTLAAIREAKSHGVLTIGITNVVGSTQSRETDAGIYTRAGLEISVASTKAFTSQVVALVLLTLLLGRQRELSLSEGQSIVKELMRLPELIKKTLSLNGQIKDLAQKYKDYKNLLYFGRKYNYPIAREGAHKIKETAYIFAEGLWGGEPKHCELSLISESVPSICIVPNDSVYDKMLSNIEEIKARKGPIIAIATEGNGEIKNITDDVIYIPKTIELLTPVLSVIPLQLFAYHVANALGREIDKPRNLAKSVTVE